MSQPPTVQGAKQPGRWDFLQNWAVFVVLISVLPLILAFVIALFTGRAITAPTILGKGELLIAALAVTADAAGSLHGKELHDRRLAVSNLCNLWTYIMVGLVGLLIARRFQPRRRYWPGGRWPCSVFRSCSV